MFTINFSQIALIDLAIAPLIIRLDLADQLFGFDLGDKKKVREIFSRFFLSYFYFNIVSPAAQSISLLKRPTQHPSTLHGSRIPKTTRGHRRRP